MLNWLKRLLGLDKQHYKQQTSTERTIPIAVDADGYGQAQRRIRQQQEQQLLQDKAREAFRLEMQRKLEQEREERKAVYQSWKENAAAVNARYEREQAAKEQKALRRGLYLVA